MQRQGLNKAENDMKDIIEVFHEIAVVKRFKTPIFVTEGAKFPPLDAAGVNKTSLQLEFVNLKNITPIITSYKKQQKTLKY